LTSETVCEALGSAFTAPAACYHKDLGAMIQSETDLVFAILRAIRPDSARYFIAGKAGSAAEPLLRLRAGLRLSALSPARQKRR